MPKSPQPTRKIRPKPAPYVKTKKNGPKAKGPAAATSALPPVTNRRSNLTLNDWLQVLEFAEQHPLLSQHQVVEHFANLKTGALIFTQGTLSRKLAPDAQKQLRARVQQHPNALSMKRARVVTRPDIERMIILWFRSMIEKREVVTGAMLHTKRRIFEDKVNVPQEERPGPGWVQSFCRAYNIREFRRHGEAASVDLVAVEAERTKLREDLKPYAKRDRWNIDESSLYPYATPDRGLSDCRIPGKKGNKFRITLVFACNADGSERREIMFIGKAHKPLCFKKKTGEQLGYYYRNNKKAWMTSELFTEWLRKFDLDMKKQGRKIHLTLDNFSGHYVPYVPKNICLRFFEPNMTPFVQPLDAGIIRCFKAHFRKEICLRALQRDEDGEPNIWTINQLESMFLAKTAWAAVTQSTIAHCWNHTQIQPEDTVATPSATQGCSSKDISLPLSKENASLEAGWAVILQFAETSMCLPDAEAALKQTLGDAFKDEDWRPALALITEFDPSEGDPIEFGENLKLLKPYILHAAPPPSTPSLSASTNAETVRSADLISAEEALVSTMKALQTRKIIKGRLASLDEFMDHPEETEAQEESPYLYKGGDDEIIAAARYELAVESGEIIEIEEDDDQAEQPEPELSSADIMKLCSQLEKVCIQHGSDVDVLDLSQSLRSFRHRISSEMTRTAKQTNIDSYFTCQ